MSSRPRKTLADYVVIAISPLLIMALVGSLVFFLLEVVYRGPHAGRLRWVLFWFVFATVLIARIGIEQGKGAARVYAVVFWAAVILVILRFVPGQAIVALPLLAVAWWSTNRLTADCTLIDDSQDASGEGLMQAAGLERKAESGKPKAEGEELESGSDLPLSAFGFPLSDDPQRTDRPHAPGLWVVYFSLAALPLFGLGQVFLPADDVAGRAFAFRMLSIYVAAGIGLLLTTSFLGLRRYLRQRRLTMPAAVTGTWLGTGTLLAVGVLVLALLLPRPDAAYSMTALIDRAGEEVGRAARWALGDDDAGKGKGRPTGKADPRGEDGEREGRGARGEGREQKSNDNASQRGQSQQGQSQQDQSQQGQSQQGQSQQDQSGSAHQQRDETGSDESQSRSGSETAGEPSPRRKHPLSSAPGWIAAFFKWVIYGLLAVAVLVALFVYRAQVLHFLRAVWTDLRNLLAALFGLFRPRAKDRPAAASVADVVAQPVRPFASYRNPFTSGQGRGMSPEELVRYTFAAFEAWGTEAGRPRGGEQTAQEYAVHIGHSHAELAAAARDLGQLYTQTAYSSQPLPPDTHQRLAALWRALEATPRATV